VINPLKHRRLLSLVDGAPSPFDGRSKPFNTNGGGPLYMQSGMYARQERPARFALLTRLVLGDDDKVCQAFTCGGGAVAAIWYLGTTNSD